MHVKLGREPMRLEVKAKSAPVNSGWVFFCLLAAYCLWIVSLPVFPSQDGPVHLYYAQAVAHLLSRAPAFVSEYQLVHLLPPYSLHYYFLMFLLHWVSPPLAEKLLACVVVLVTGYGLRFFAGRIGPSGCVLSLWALPLVLHRYVFLGLYNYCLALGLAFFAMGVWCRPNRAEWRQRLVFLLLIGLITLTHPVPLPILLGYCAALLGLGKLSRRGEQSASTLPRPVRGDWIVLLAASVSLIYVLCFRNPAGIYPDQVPVGAVQGFRLHGERFRDFVELFLVSPVVLRPYRYALGGVVLSALAAGLTVAIRDLARRCYTVAQVTLGWGLLMVVGVAVLPTWINGSALFAERLTVPCVLLLLAAVSGWKWIQQNSMVIVGGAVYALLALAALQVVIGPAAKRIALPEPNPAIAPYGHAIFISTMNTPIGLTFDPCRSAGVRLIQQDRGVWLNPPWLGSPQLMLGQRHPPVTISELLANDPGLAVVVGHCGGPDAGLTSSLENSYPGRWVVTRYFWANVLVPAAR
jgi:hypothetical protein